MLAVLLFASLFLPGHSIPPPTPDVIDSYKPIPEYINQTHDLHIGFVKKRDQASPGSDYSHNFRYAFVDQQGNRVEQIIGRNDVLEVSFTQTVSKLALDIALKIVRLQCRNMPRSVWLRLCANGAVGVFTRAEGTTIFPEYIQYRDTPQCRGRCDGSCSRTCTADGRKYDSLAGLGGARATCVDDNILCNRNDPYRGQSNILLHEFTHTIHGYGLDPQKKAEIDAAYNNARRYRIWNTNSYAMSTSYEYFAEAAGVFFHANNYLQANGGMSNCFGRGSCRDQAEARAWLKYKDNTLYWLLSYTFTNYRPQLEGGLGRCVKL